jgi:uncharacterized OB-fold protein
MRGVTVGECQACGARRFPVPIWCHVCGSDNIKAKAVWSGTVAETTVVRHAPGRRLAPLQLGTVRLSAGGVVIARLEAPVGEGSRVHVFLEGGVPVARQPTR